MRGGCGGCETQTKGVGGQGLGIGETWPVSVKSGVLPEEFRPATFEEEETADLRRAFVRQAIRLTLAFALLVLFVFLALSWSGAAVRFGASRVADRGTPTWIVGGTVRNAVTREPVPWAKVDDDPAGQPPFFHSDADRTGVFELLTLSEQHRIIVSAPGYRPSTIGVGRVWFLWMPRGRERQDVALSPE
jgi:hypothetical protein